MVTSLYIENFALIEKLSISFTKGFSIITGETGAGKSILLGALGLALGKRADLTSLRNKEQKCIIEVQFLISDYNLQPFFESQDLDYEAETIIRREILPSGKSRAFVNDSPVNLQQLQDLSQFLIDIHSQHETRELSDEEFQFKIIDAIAKNAAVLSEYRIRLKRYKSANSDLNVLKTKRSEALKEQDYNLFLLDELLSAKLIDGDQELLEATLAKLNNVEFIKENLDKAFSLATEDQFGSLSNLKEFKVALQKVANLSPDFQLLFDRIDSVLIEFSDIVNELEDLNSNVSGDPEQLEAANQKLQLIYTLQKKHQVNTIAELIVIQNELDNRALSVSEMEIQIDQKENEVNILAEELDTLAEKIRDNRKTAMPLLSEKLMVILDQLGMPNVRFKIETTPLNQYGSNGKDELQFLFSANKGSDFGLMKKVASGGEMSRIMLAVKSILASYSHLPTMIFDEIDTGVSGEIANKMGDIMKEMSGNMQVFAITHLPQIAAKGLQHFKVFKSVSDNNTQSQLKLLSDEERVVEIAQMLSGTVVSDSAINHAKALLN